MSSSFIFWKYFNHWILMSETYAFLYNKNLKNKLCLKTIFVKNVILNNKWNWEFAVNRYVEHSSL
jgi:hypothetical protein